jgi:hypothetical protein
LIAALGRVRELPLLLATYHISIDSFPICPKTGLPTLKSNANYKRNWAKAKVLLKEPL